MPNVSEQEIRSYLLGELSPERQTELAAEIHNDAGLQEELLAVEEELFDLYLAGSLNADEQQYFETHFLSSESGQQKLHFARLLRNYRDSYLQQESLVEDRVPAPITPVPVTGPSPWYANSHRTPAYALSMVLVAGFLVTLVIWVYVSKSPTTHTTARTFPLTLTAGSTRSGGSITELRAPAQHDQVKVELEVAKPDFKKYKTQLFRENQALASQEELPIVPKNTHYVVPVTFTGNLLTPGDYQLKLCGVADSGQPEFIDSYSFRVTAEGAPDPDQERNRLAR
ncbi:MAG TPA: hypothetical protein VFY61_17250 [Pyrinomonadaceae bacterium]|nr:hypothetical protein [Pyrinomonadaceae bacterium]